jgi:hypothetical protein
VVPVPGPGSQVYQLKFDYQTALELFYREDDGTIGIHIDLVIYLPFVLRSSDGTVHNLDPQTGRAGLAPVLDLFQGYDWPERRFLPRLRLRGRPGRG